AAICKVPIAFVSFIDDEIQWYKSITGIELKSISREISLCYFMLSTGERLIVGDLERHEVLRDNPFVTGALHIRSCISIPIKNGDNHIIGSLFVVDNQSREFESREIDAMEALARQTEEHLEVRRRILRTQKTAQAEQKILESQLLRTEFRLTSVLEKLPNIVLYETSNNPDWEGDQEREYISSNIIDMLGYPPEMFTSNTMFFSSLIHPDDTEKTDNEIREWSRNNHPGVLHLEFRCRRSDGQYSWIHDSVVCVKTIGDENSWFMSGVMIDVSARRNAEEQLRQSVSHINALFNNSLQAFILLDTDLRILAFNRIAQIGAITIWGQKLVVGNVISEIIFPDYKQQYIEYCKMAFAGNSHIVPEILLKTYNGGEVWLEISFVPVVEEGSKVKKICFSGLDITKRKKAQKKLLSAENNYRSIVENAVIGIFQVLPNGEFLSVNPAMAAMLGFDSPEELMEHREAIDNYVLPEKRKEFIDLLNEHGEIEVFEFQGKKRSGEIAWFSQGARAVYTGNSQDGSVLYYEGFTRDITERKKAELKLQTSLQEKELLLKEIHHRVKNNLQIISSLLNLQAELITDEQMLGLFKDSQSRVRTMALIHEQLYRSFNVGTVDFRSYVQYLVQFLERTYHFAPCNVEFKNEIDEIDLAIDLAVPCGLIINELVSNALKYAFGGMSEGVIAITILRLYSGSNKILIQVADSGCGISDGAIVENPPTLGLQLVQMLTKQLGGTLSFEWGSKTKLGGTEIRIIFPEATKNKE
ncbi:MAG: PAS domain S-box protein, partial [Ignavibacteriae bacterium]|nr:PAS domain S-box protein [Ignavibacteriota bacterium]